MSSNQDAHAPRRADRSGPRRVRRGPRALQRDDRQRPRADRALRRRRRRDRRGRASPATTASTLAVRGGGHNGAGLGSCDDGAGHRPLAHARRPRRSRGPHGPRWRAAHAGRRRPRHPRLRPGHSQRDHLHDRRRRAHPRRRASATSPAVRPHDRQPARGGHGAGGRQLRHRQRGRAPGPLLGDPRRRRQLRRRHLLPFQLHPVSTVYGGPMLWPLDGPPRCCAGTATSCRSAPEDLNGFFAFLSVPPGAALPRGAARQKMCGVVWCYTGPLDQADDGPRARRASSGRPRSTASAPMPYPGAAAHVRRALPARLPVVLAGGLRRRADRRGDRPSTSSTARQLPDAASRPCTSTRSTAPRAASASDDTAWGYRDAPGRR